MTITSIDKWHMLARPEPTDKDFNVQLGCHFEEIAEMEDMVLWQVADPADGLMFNALRAALLRLSNGLKTGTITAKPHDRKEFLDSLCDQIVTAVGVGHCADMNVPSALEEVDTSNWSKYDDKGMPIFDANGKIAKGPNYRKPNLLGCY